jgi:antirepressor protein
MDRDAERAENVLIPVDQDTVPFYGRDLVAVRLPDGQICAVLRWLCDGLSLNIQSQLRHIRGRVVLSDGLRAVRVETEGGPQAMPALTLDVLPSWLCSIDERRVKEEARADVIRFQRECAKVLAEHFARKAQAALPAPTALVPSEPTPTQPAAPAPDAPRDAWRTYHQGMLAWLNWLDDMDRWQNLTEVQLDEHEERLRDHDRQIGELHSRVEGTEELSRVLAEALARLGPQTLTPAHQATIKHQAARLHELAGLAYATIYSDLTAAFHVGKYSDIPDAHWPEIAAWFKTRIAAAEQRSGQH